jgi:hypothetical protein
MTEKGSTMIVWIHLDAEGRTTVKCPHCGQQKKIKMPRIDGIGRTFKIKATCTCGKSFILASDKRRHVRKPTNLTGGYFHLRREYRGLITVKSLSESGAGIELNTERTMLKNDRLIIKFNLDDEAGTYVEKEAQIKRAKGLELGLEFLNPLPAKDPLRAYLS